MAVVGGQASDQPPMTVSIRRGYSCLGMVGSWDLGASVAVGTQGLGDSGTRCAKGAIYLVPKVVPYLLAGGVMQIQ